MLASSSSSMARPKRTSASSRSWWCFSQEFIVSERVVLSLRISLVASGVSQKSFLDMILSISLSRFCFPAKSKITPELF
jgi:hypothetical protein